MSADSVVGCLCVAHLVGSNGPADDVMCVAVLETREDQLTLLDWVDGRDRDLLWLAGIGV